MIISFHKSRYRGERRNSSVLDVKSCDMSTVNGGWGTEKGMTVLATMFQIQIFVFCTYGKKQTWIKTGPHFNSSNCLPVPV